MQWIISIKKILGLISYIYTFYDNKLFQVLLPDPADGKARFNNALMHEKARPLRAASLQTLGERL